MVTRLRQDDVLSLTELAEAAGLSRQTVQYYAMVGLIEESERTAGGHRLFDRDTINRVKLIHRLNKSGYALRDIKETFLKRWAKG